VFLAALVLVSLPGALSAQAADQAAASAHEALLNAKQQARAARLHIRAERRAFKQLRRAEQQMKLLCPQQVPPQPPFSVSGGDRMEALARTDELPVIVIQYALKATGAYDGLVDGLAGPETTAATRVFQKRLSAQADGRLSPEQTVALIQMAATGGQAESQNTLGMMLASGVGLPRNDAAAVDWFQRAAAQNNPFGTYNLGVMVRDGRGGGVHYQDAVSQAAGAVFPEARMLHCLKAEAKVKELSR
jgi:TPR repeat protein